MFLGDQVSPTTSALLPEGPERDADSQLSKVLCQEAPKAPLWFYWWKTRQWVRNVAHSGHFHSGTSQSPLLIFSQCILFNVKVTKLIFFNMIRVAIVNFRSTYANFPAQERT